MKFSYKHTRYPWILFFWIWPVRTAAPFSGSKPGQLPATGHRWVPVGEFGEEIPMEAEPLIESSFRRLLASLDARPCLLFCLGRCFLFGSMENWWVHSVYIVVDCMKKVVFSNSIFFGKKAVRDWWTKSTLSHCLSRPRNQHHGITGGTVEPPQNDLNSNVQYLPSSHMLHVWNIYLHVPYVWAKSRQIFHTWSIWAW